MAITYDEATGEQVWEPDNRDTWWEVVTEHEKWIGRVLSVRTLSTPVRDANGQLIGTEKRWRLLELIDSRYWSRMVLRVRPHATETFPRNRQQVDLLHLVSKTRLRGDDFDLNSVPPA